MKNKKYKILRLPHGYFKGGVLDTDISPTITTRTGDAQLDLIIEYETETIQIFPISKRSK